MLPLIWTGYLGACGATPAPIACSLAGLPPNCMANPDLTRIGVFLSADQLAFVDAQRAATGESRSGWLRRLVAEQAEWAAQVQARRQRGAA